MGSPSEGIVGKGARLRVAPAVGMLGLFLVLWPLRRASAENRVEYRFSDYIEDSDRIKVQTHSVWFEYDLQSKVALRGSYVNDAISGATPTGEVLRDGTAVSPVQLRDERNAGFLETAIRAGRTTTTPQVSYSEESDYRSLGLSLTEAIDFNERNTTLVLGGSHNADHVGRSHRPDSFRYKGESEALVGLNQILGPRTVLTANLTVGYADGYLSDPYKRVSYLFDYPGFPQSNGLSFDADHRPRHKFKQVAFLGLNQAVPSLDASIDIGYRFHHDDWGIVSNTGEVTWNQRLLKRVIVSPSFRYYRQSAASFYTTRVNTDLSAPDQVLAFDLEDNFVASQGDGSGIFETDVLGNPGAYNIVKVPAAPRYYSADYRLSEMETLTYGVTVAIQLHEKVTLNLGYQRYQMHGLDRVTPQSMYPKANVFSVGLAARF
jgi:hypothetical protein